MEIKVSKNQDQSIGWYTLAQLVSSKEKERALGVLRLLTYSFNDEAYGHQIAGDLLRAFDDADALNKYQTAARLYREGGRIIPAIGVYEHLLTLDPKGYEYCTVLLDLYASVGNMPRLQLRTQTLLDLHAQGIVRTDQVHSIVKKVAGLLEQHHESHIKQQYEKWVVTTSPLMSNVIAP